MPTIISLLLAAKILMKNTYLEELFEIWFWYFFIIEHMIGL
jgi:hypothetical protein